MDVRASILFPSQTASGTPLTQKVRHARPSLSNRFSSPGLKLSTADLDNCGKLPITTIGNRSSSVVQHLARPAGSLRLQPVLTSRTTSRSTSNKLQLAASLPRQKPSPTSDIAQLSSPSRIVSPCADCKGSALCNVLQTRQPCVFGRPSCTSRRVHFADPRSCSAAAAAGVAAAALANESWSTLTSTKRVPSKCLRPNDPLCQSGSRLCLSLE